MKTKITKPKVNRLPKPPPPLRIRPKHAFRYANTYRPELDPARVYTAVLATNQPDWERDGKIFVYFSDGGPNDGFDDPDALDRLSIMLERGDYDIVE